MELLRGGVRGAPFLLGMVAALSLGACGSDTPSGPRLALQEVAGIYDVAVLTFDPQGSLPAADIKARLSSQQQPPYLNLGTDGTAQLVFQNPSNSLLVTVKGSFTTGQDFVTVTWDEAGYEQFLLSRRMTFDFSATGSGTLSFTGASPDGVSRTRLIQLVPEWQNEQLFDPVPGQLQVVFAGRASAGG